jgi:hypothetical protein
MNQRSHYIHLNITLAPEKVYLELVSKDASVQACEPPFAVGKFRDADNTCRMMFIDAIR